MIWKEMGRSMQIKQSTTWASELLCAWNSPDEELRYQTMLNLRKVACRQEKTALESLHSWCREQLKTYAHPPTEFHSLKVLLDMSLIQSLSVTYNISYPLQLKSMFCCTLKNDLCLVICTANSTPQHSSAFFFKSKSLSIHYDLPPRLGFPGITPQCSTLLQDTELPQ